MKLNIRDFKKVLDDNLELYKTGKKAKNLYFLCRHDIIIDDIIDEWLGDASINVIKDAYPSILYEENAQGILLKSKPAVYVLSNALQDRMEEPFILYYRMLNHGRDTNGDDLLVNFIKNDVAPNASFAPFDLKNRMFTIAFGFKEDSGNSVVTLNKDLLDLFDVYELDVDLQFLLQFMYQRELEQIKGLETLPTGEEREEWINETKQTASYLKRLIDTGFNIQDCGVYLINNIDGVCDFDETTSFEEFKSNLLKEVEQGLESNLSGPFRTTNKINEDYRAIIEWLKQLD